ncbi:hypothetical protein HOY80DRAFT_879012, partial [Tuber brumale]
RSPVTIGEGDHLYTSGLRRIRQQTPLAGTQSFVIPHSMSVPGTRVNSLSIPPTSPTLGFCEDLARFPTESLHSFSFAHQSEDLIHSRQNILKRSIEFMRDKLGWGSQSPMITSAQAKVEGDEEVAKVMELLRKANLVSEEKTPLMNGPATGPAGFEGNPFEKSFAPETPVSPQTQAANPALPLRSTDLAGSFNGESRSESTSRSTTNDSISTAHSSPPSTRRASLKRTYTDTTSLTVQTKLYEALAQPYLASDMPQSATGMGPRPIMSKSSVHGHTSRYTLASQAIFTTEAHHPWTILAANDLACLVFGVTKAEVRKIGILEVVKEERREWLTNKLNSGENSSSSFPYPHSHHGSPNVTSAMFQNGPYGNGNRRVKSDAYYTGSPIRSGGCGAGVTQPSMHHSQNKSRGVILCGDVVPIQKRNGNTGAASLWVKEKRGGLIWVVEEISEDVAFLYTSNDPDLAGKVMSFSGNMTKIFGEDSIPDGGVDVSDFIPMIPRNGDGTIDLEQTTGIHQFTAMNSIGMRIPCGVEPIPGEGALRVSSFPHIAGIIVLSATTLRITSSNAVFSAALFGHLNPVGLPITEIIPQFDRILKFITDEDKIDLVDGIVVPEHSFRKAKAVLALRDGKGDAASMFVRSGGLTARHRDGAELRVDVQMRVVMSEPKDEEAVIIDDPDETGTGGGEVVYALWITYSRHMHASSLTSDPSNNILRRPITPPKRPSPGQPSTPIASDGQRSDNGTLLTRQLEAIQQSPTPPSSEDESTEPSGLVSTSGPQGISKRKKNIQDFVILEEMGQGAYGQVKLARYKRNQAKRVVLKYVTKRRILVDTWTRDRRLGTVPLEIHVLDYLRRDGLRHPNIVEMTDFFEDDINYYIEMIPHGLPGMDLFDYIELKVNMDEDECRSIFIQVARALHHLHTKAGVVHRDIKDENVVLDGEGNIKVIDFGSAAYIRNGPFDVFVGTIGIDYAAPEVLAGKSYKGKEQDVWALGVLLYTICYKENPFYNIDEIMDRELRIPFILSEVSLELIRLMLDRDVERRPTIEQVLAHSWFDDLPNPEEALLAESAVQASFPR